MDILENISILCSKNGYIGQYIRFLHYFSPMYNVSTWVKIRIYWKIYVPRASGPLDYIFQYIRILTHVLYHYELETPQLRLLYSGLHAILETVQDFLIKFDIKPLRGRFYIT